MLALLTQRDAARTLKLSVRTLERYRVRGGGPKYSKIGRLVRYNDHDLEAWVASRAVSNTSGGGRDGRD
jgi:hypothetical protein